MRLLLSVLLQYKTRAFAGNEGGGSFVSSMQRPSRRRRESGPVPAGSGERKFIPFSGSEPRAVALSERSAGRGMQGVQSREREGTRARGCAAQKWTGATLQMNPSATTLESPRTGCGSGKPPLGPGAKGTQASLATYWIGLD